MPLREALEALGARVLALPAIDIRPPEDVGPIDAALRQLSTYDWIALSSRHAVRAVFERLVTLGREGPWPSGLRVAAAGPSTARELAERGVEVHCVPETAGGGALADALARRGIAGARVLIPVGDLAKPDLRAGLQRAGAGVHQVIAYRTVKPSQSDDRALSELRAGAVDAVILASPSALAHLSELLDGDTGPLRSTALVCIGPTTAAAVRALGLEPGAVAGEPSTAGLVQAVIDIFTGGTA